VQAEAHTAYSDGFLLYTNSGITSSPLMAQAFDVASFRTMGEPFPVAEFVDVSAGIWAQHQFSVSNNGVIAYSSNPNPSRLTWLDRNGRVLGHVGVPDPSLRTVTISPDGTTVAAESGQSGTFDIWLHDLARGSSSRFTLNAPGSASMTPTWAPDRKSLLFVYADKTHPTNIMKKYLGSGGAPEFIASGWGDPPRPVNYLRWSPDGKYVVARLNPGGYTGADLWILPLDPPGQKPRPFMQSAANEGSPAFSPAGDWLAYASDETRSSKSIFSRSPISAASIRCPSTAALFLCGVATAKNCTS
jgi:WD40 repeat protein